MTTIVAALPQAGRYVTESHYGCAVWTGKANRLTVDGDGARNEELPNPSRWLETIKNII